MAKKGYRKPAPNQKWFPLAFLGWKSFFAHDFSRCLNFGFEQISTYWDCSPTRRIKLIAAAFNVKQIISFPHENNTLKALHQSLKQATSMCSSSGKYWDSITTNL
jgi:hypothetical protein